MRDKIGMLFALLIIMLSNAVAAQPNSCVSFSKEQALFIVEERGGLVAEVRGKTGLCKGCGCKGGPGYRILASSHCAGYVNLIKECGPAPHTQGCRPECVPVVVGYAKPVRPEQSEAEIYMQERKALKAQVRAETKAKRAQMRTVNRVESPLQSSGQQVPQLPVDETARSTIAPPPPTTPDVVLEDRSALFGVVVPPR